MIFGLVSNFRGYFPRYSELAQKDRQSFSWTILKGRTRNNAGRVQIRSTNPRDVPDVNFHYFDESNVQGDRDLEAVADAVDFVRGITDAYRSDWVEGEETPGPGIRTRDQIRQFIKDEAWGHHASGTCKIGVRSDPMSVVDSCFRVHGTRGLRVVDASVFPRIPGLFIVAAIYMVAEKAADAILADRGKGANGHEHD
jgi:choline dehydrogenase